MSQSPGSQQEGLGLRLPSFPLCLTSPLLGLWALGLESCVHLAKILNSGCDKNHLFIKELLKDTDVWALPHTSEIEIFGDGTQILVFLKSPSCDSY